jgi:putative ABC transport system permease protein
MHTLLQIVRYTVRAPVENSGFMAAAVVLAAGTLCASCRAPRDTPRAAAASVHLPRTRFAFRDPAASLHRLLAGVRALPGVESAALATPVPAGDLVCATAGGGLPAVTAGLARVSPEYFRTLGIPLRGRDFGARDDGSAPPVVIVNETLARRLWPAGDPIGRRLRLSGPHEPLREVVGVARDRGPDTPAGPAGGLVYVPDGQAPAAAGRVSLVVRTTDDAPSLRVPLAQLVEAVDPELPVGAVDLDFTPHTPFE